MKKIGIILFVKSNKTRTVFIKQLIKHKFYNKYIFRTQTFLIHDQTNASQKGDLVEIKQVRPLSRKKNFILTKILNVNKLII